MIRASKLVLFGNLPLPLGHSDRAVLGFYELEPWLLRHSVEEGSLLSWRSAVAVVIATGLKDTEKPLRL